MSYEGYTQYLCKKGHYTTKDCYYDDLKSCPTCKEEIVWQEMVDTTNDEGNPTKLKLRKRKTCKHCKSVLEEIYYIPKGHQ